MDENIEQQIKEMIVERLFLKTKPQDMENDKGLIDVYGIDSFNIMEIVVGLEELYGITIKPGEFKLSNFKTVGTIAEFVRSKKK
ncbi:MAG: acyl carrier protein [Victivallales bacterium]